MPNPKVLPVSLATLHQLSPELSEDFREQLEAAVVDCKQRPAIKKKREVQVRLIIEPHPDDPDDVLIRPITTRKTPARELDKIRVRRTHRNQLQFDFTEDE